MTATEVLKKHGVKPSKNARSKKAVEGRAIEINKEIRQEKGPSRNDLMLQAKEKGIKYFRILNKENLQKVLDPSISAEAINDIITKARETWKAGFGSRKKATIV